MFFSNFKAFFRSFNLQSFLKSQQKQLITKKLPIHNHNQKKDIRDSFPQPISTWKNFLPFPHFLIVRNDNKRIQIVVNVIQIQKKFSCQPQGMKMNETTGTWVSLEFSQTWPWTIYDVDKSPKEFSNHFVLTPHVPSPAIGIVNPLLSVTVGTLTILRVEK